MVLLARTRATKPLITLVVVTLEGLFVRARIFYARILRTEPRSVSHRNELKES
jgi:hypothetical protein